MPSDTKLTIPTQYYDGFKHLLNMESPALDALERGLSLAKPSIYRQRFIESVADNSGLSVSEISAIVPPLIGLYIVRSVRDIDIDKLAADVCVALQKSDDPKLVPKGGSWEDFKTDLKRFLVFEQSIGLTAKAYDVMSEHQRIYCNNDTRIITDLRPVFIEKQPLAATIIHNLKICYHENDEHKEFYVALDTNDVRELRELLDRADDKAKQLKDVIDIAKMLYLDADTK